MMSTNDVLFLPDEFILSGENIVVRGRIEGKTRSGGAPVEVRFAHVWLVQGHSLGRLRAFTDTAVLTDLLRRTSGSE